LYEQVVHKRERRPTNMMMGSVKPAIKQQLDTGSGQEPAKKNIQSQQLGPSLTTPHQTASWLRKSPSAVIIGFSTK